MIRQNIINAIAKSPFKLIRSHMECVSFSMKTILPFIKNIELKRWHKANMYYIEILKFEKDAHYIKKMIKNILSDNILMIISKTELISLIATQDKIMCYIKYISSLLISKDAELPSIVLDDIYFQLIQSCVDACNATFLTVLKLEKIIENGFPKKEIKIIEQMIKKAYTIDSASSKFQLNIRKKIFRSSDEKFDMEIIYICKIVELTGKISSSSKKVCSKVKLILQI